MEWATDVLFDSQASLAALYPDLTLHAIRRFGSHDVMRFLQRKLVGHFQGDITSGFKKRVEGVRVKHFVNANSIKMYDKHGQVLRVETTINRARDFRVFRPKEGDPHGERSWRLARKGVADLHRVTEIAQKANCTYLDALAAVDPSEKVRDLFDPITKPARLRSQRFRCLRPWDHADRQLLQAVGRAEFFLHGFRNRDLTALLHTSKPKTPNDARRRSARVGRLIRLLRAHGIIRKLPHTHRYRVSDKGARIINAVIAANEARVGDLHSAA